MCAIAPLTLTRRHSDCPVTAFGPVKLSRIQIVHGRLCPLGRTNMTTGVSNRICTHAVHRSSLNVEPDS